MQFKALPGMMLFSLFPDMTDPLSVWTLKAFPLICSIYQRINITWSSLFHPNCLRHRPYSPSLVKCIACKISQKSKRQEQNKSNCSKAHKYPFHKERKVTIKPGYHAIIVTVYFKQAISLILIWFWLCLIMYWGEIWHWKSLGTFASSKIRKKTTNCPFLEGCI